MSVFILGGKAKGQEIHLPAKINFRPTSVMLRRKLFDSKQNWEGLTFIDLCAGSGVMGWEALSRGAGSIILNDSSYQQQKILQHVFENWVDHHPEDSSKVKISHLDVLKFFELLEITPGTWLFFDPPYHDEKLYQKFVQILLTKSFPASSGVVIEFEQKKNCKLPWMDELEKFRSNKVSRELISSDRKLCLIEIK